MEREAIGPHSEPKVSPLSRMLRETIERRRTTPGMQVSQRVIWLASQIETEQFWQNLNIHLSQDKSGRMSVGGVFERGAGENRIGPYSWNQVFSSLDTFLKHYDLRATEFLFRDFQPEHQDFQVNKLINASRRLAMDKYPRLRRLYWEDYQDSLNEPGFWRALTDDLQKLNRKVSVNKFFKFPKMDQEERSELVAKSIGVKKTFEDDLEFKSSALGTKARFIEYHNLAQILRDRYKTDPRTFLLDFKPSSLNPVLEDRINQAKQLISEKILPVVPPKEAPKKIKAREFGKIIDSKEFWDSLFSDLNNHFSSPRQADTFKSFLSYFNRQTNNLEFGSARTYKDLLTHFVKSTKGLKRKLPNASEKLADYLMWDYEPTLQTQDSAANVKSLCAQMFTEDCLYVALQTQDHWKGLSQNLTLVQGQPTFMQFLRYFSKQNLSCKIKEHKKGSSYYQRFAHKPYHKQKDFNSFLRRRAVHTGNDYKDGIKNIFWEYAPSTVKLQMLKKFPNDFDKEQIQKQNAGKKLLDDAKLAVQNLKNKTEFSEFNFMDSQTAANFVDKLRSVARTQKVKIITRRKGSILKLKVALLLANS